MILPSKHRAVPTGRRPWLRSNLQVRITLALAAVGLLPLAAAALLLTRIQRQGFSEQVLATHSVAAATAAERAGAVVGSVVALADSLAGNPSLVGDGRSEAARELLVGLLQARPDLGALAVLNADGALVIRAQRKDFGAEMEGVLARRQEQAVDVVRGEQATWLAIERPLAGAAGRLRLVADAAPLIEAVERIEISGEEAELVLATRQGRVLAGTADSLAGFPPALVAAAAVGRASGAGAYPGAGGEDVLGAFAPVPGALAPDIQGFGQELGWYVVSRQPRRLAESIRLAVRRDSALAVGLAAILVAALAGVAHSSLVAPIRRLTEEQRRLAGFLPAPPAAGGEIEALQAAFQLLERKVRDSEELGRVFLGRYQVLEQIGAGAMGTVFLGWDPKLKRRLALKTVRLDAGRLGLKHGELSRKLLQEAVTTARFNHPHIVSVHDVEWTPEVAFIAMEHVDGVGLDWLLWRRRPLAEEESVLLAHAIASALAAAHAKGIVHRDVKPSNVLLGFDGAIKVTDFGIAELATAGADPQEIFFGTPGYIPPEALRGESYGPPGDLFALGVVLYECLTGRQPFLRGDLKQTIAITVDREPEALTSFEPGLSPEIETLTRRLLRKVPGERPSSAAVVRSFADLIDQRGLRWDPSGLPPKTGPAGFQPTGSWLLPTLTRPATRWTKR